MGYIRFDESEFQFDLGDDDKALPAFLNSIAENFAKTPIEILHGQGFSRLLFAKGIVMDNTNLSSPYWAGDMSWSDVERREPVNRSTRGTKNTRNIAKPSTCVIRSQALMISKDNKLPTL